MFVRYNFFYNLLFDFYVFVVRDRVNFLVENFYYFYKFLRLKFFFCFLKYCFKVELLGFFNKFFICLFVKILDLLIFSFMLLILFKFVIRWLIKLFIVVI